MTRDDLLARFRATRQLSLDLCKPLKAEDYRIQSMPDVSPPWWNLGHTSWFFAKNILEPRGRGCDEDARLAYVLNSYYEVHGERVPRTERGLQTRPTTEEIFAFREHTDERMAALIGEVADADWEEIEFLVKTGIQHEQQHQELFVTEIKHILGSNDRRLREPYRDAPAGTAAEACELLAVNCGGGLEEFGNVEGGWCWDNEMPVHRAWLGPFAVANRLISNAEFEAFVQDGGYDDPLLWLANGWEARQRHGWEHPLYWERVDGTWQIWSLAGMRPLEAQEPVCHVSFYEADAFARWWGEGHADWQGCRLPTEREWEQAARTHGFEATAGNFLDDGMLHPVAPRCANGDLSQAEGDLWEWTSNHYEAYPGYVPFDGDLMEYNGKFMDNQRVLRGGSCATPRSHIRVSYRNFWAPDTRFQFSGIRLARSLDAPHHE